MTKLRNLLRTEKRFENKEVIFNLMLFEKQLQDLQENFSAIKELRDKHQGFTDIIAYVRDNFTVSQPETSPLKLYNS